MTRTRVLLRVAAIVAAFVFAQELVLFLYQFGFQVASGDEFSPPPSTYLAHALPIVVVSSFVLGLGFGAGVFLALRLIAPVTAVLSWRRVVVRGLVASAFGALGVFVLRLVELLLAAVRIGPYPLGYSFSASFDASNVGIDLLGNLESALAPFVYNLPLGILACVFVKLWSKAHAVSTDATDRVSASA